MTIAVMMDFEGESLSNRDGIFLHSYHLIKAWLEYNKKINIEIWVFKHSQKEAEAFFEELKNHFGDRIMICSDCAYRSINCMKSFFWTGMKKILENVERKFFSCFTEGIDQAIIHKAEVCGKKADEARHHFVKAFKAESKSDICYVPFVTLRKALKCNRPVAVQVHDLFTFQFYHLFMKESNPPALYFKYNLRVRNLLTGYAKKGAVFITSSEYTVRNQILKFIRAITEQQCKVILFPPLLSQFEDETLPSKKDFLEHFGISGSYIAFPSQNRPNKNLILLLKALKEVNEEGHPLTLVTTGRMEDVRATREFCEKNTHLPIIEIGDLSSRDLFCLYKYSNMIVCPNLIEGMGISGQAMEALKIGGIPIIHVKTLGVEKLLEKLGMSINTADLNWVDLDDSHGMAQKIIEVLQNPEKSVQKQKEIIKAFERITWRDAADEYLILFEKQIKHLRGQYKKTRDCK